MDNDNMQLAKRRHFTPLGFVVLVAVLTAIAMAFWYYWPSNNNVAQNCSGKIINGKCEPKPKSGAGNKTSPAPGSSKNKSSKSGGGTTVLPAPAGSGSKSGSASSTNSGKGASNLTNTGPGNTIALFIGTASVAGLAHYLYHRRRAKA